MRLPITISKDISGQLVQERKTKTKGSTNKMKKIIQLIKISFRLYIVIKIKWVWKFQEDREPKRK